MKRFALLLLSICTWATQIGFAQDLKILNVEEDTENGIGVYPCGERHEAMLQFETYESFALEFRWNYDPDLKVQMDSLAGKKTYTIIFVTQAPGVNYDGRRLTIIAPGFRAHRMTLNLRDKQKFIYKVSDPYSALRSPYFILQEQANHHFYDAQYQRAKDVYQMIRTCPEYQVNRKNIDERIALCDSMIAWNAEAVQLTQFAQYADAADIYQKMNFYNSANAEISQKILDCRSMFREDCDNEYVLAEHYMDIKQIQLAKESYQRLLDKRCSKFMSEAAVSLQNIEKYERKKSQSARCFFYEVGPNLPIGVTYAQCYKAGRHSSGYVSLHFNPSLIGLFSGKNMVEGHLNNPADYEGLSQEALENRLAQELPNGLWQYNDSYTKTEDVSYCYPDKLDYEGAISVGWTFKTCDYLFGTIGVGYHGGGFNIFNFKDAPRHMAEAVKNDQLDITAKPFEQWTDELRHDCTKAQWFNGTDLEAGLIFKIWHMNLKGTFQYTYWINDNNFTDFLKDNRMRFFVGLGFNW